MQILTTTQARPILSELVNRIRFKNDVVAIGRRDKPEVLMIRYPVHQNPSLSDETNLNAHSDSFSFLEHEPELYSLEDLKKRYV